MSPDVAAAIAGALGAALLRQVADTVDQRRRRDGRRRTRQDDRRDRQGSGPGPGSNTRSDD